MNSDKPMLMAADARRLSAFITSTMRKRVGDYGLTDYPLVIETDSKVLVDMISKRIQSSWHFWTLLDKIFSLLQRFSFQINHTFREGNAVADSLGNKGVMDGNSKTYTATDGLPTVIKQLVLQDSRKIRVLRKRLMIL
ncbi:unnamed protein product [Ilex paraguariensis]|uniref:RNase H type-1 domain-containing protein n=1 Tax=Ilex paraguariensis TaxID=185542 RepID=A0ABC8UJD2_9AQUA